MINSGYFTSPTVDGSDIITWYTELQAIVPVTFIAYIRSPLYDTNDIRATRYEVISGSLPKNLTLTSDGYLSGTIGEMDEFIPEYMNQAKTINHVNYGTVGSASLFDNGIGVTKKVYFTIRASTDYAYVDKRFGFALKNNWSSDRDKLVEKIYGNTSSTSNL
jgi:hypothetical protein